MTQLYNREYYLNHCGNIPYDPSEPHWHQFFSSVANWIVNTFHPASSIDVGAALGFLVKSLTDLGVDAYGVDISEYAVSNNLAPDRCQHDDITQPGTPLLARSYDIATCIEVVEHIDARYERIAIHNLCRLADIVVFSSTPSDFVEATHVNVRPLAHWMELFAAEGFYVDEELLSVTTVLVPWAVVFRKMPSRHHLATEIATYEESLSALRQTVDAFHRKEEDRGLAFQELTRSTNDSLASLAQQVASLSSSLVKNHTEQMDRHRQAAENHREIEQWFRSVETKLDDERALIAATQAEMRSQSAQTADALTELRLTVAESSHYKTLYFNLRFSRAGRMAHNLGRIKTLVARVLGRGPSRTSAGAQEMSATTVPVDAPPTAESGTIQPTRPQNPEEDGAGYRQWLAARPPMGPVDVINRLRTFTYLPLISILVPVYKIEPRWLSACIESVTSQQYPHWELCLVDDCSRSEDITNLLEFYRSRFPSQIKLAVHETNQGISATTNTCLAMASGEFIGLLDHDDLLTPDALLEVVTALNQNRDIDLLYSDEDKVDDTGTFYGPFFKPDWSPRLLLSANYISHFGVYRASIMRAINGFRSEFNGSQDYDLVLRFTARTQKIHHIPKVLYHWRAIPGSTALAAREKSYAVDRAKQAISAHLQTQGLTPLAIRESPVGGRFLVEWDIPQYPLVSIIIPTHDRVELLRNCIDSVTGSTLYPNYEIIIVDHNSQDAETLRYLRACGHKVVRVAKPEFNFSELIDAGVKVSSGEFILWLNNDTLVINPDWLIKMVGEAMQPGVGVVGALLLYPNNQVQHAGVIVGLGGVAGHAHRLYRADEPGYFGLLQMPHEIEAATGACLLVRRTIYDQVGGCPKDFPINFNDVVFCLRVRKLGYRNIYTPEAKLYHLESATRAPRVYPGETERFKGEFNNVRDAYYNPNLALIDPSYQLNRAPAN